MRPVTSRNTESASACVGAAQPAGQQPHHAPQQLGLVLEGGPDRLVGNGQDLALLQGTGGRRPSFVEEQAHLTEQLTLAHQGHDRLPTVHGLVGDGHPAGLHDEQLVGLVSLVEQDVVALEAAETR